MTARAPGPVLWAVCAPAAGVAGYAGNLLAARVRTRAGHRLDSPALIADGNHARAVSDAPEHRPLGVRAAPAQRTLGVERILKDVSRMDGFLY